MLRISMIFDTVVYIPGAGLNRHPVIGKVNIDKIEVVSKFNFETASHPGRKLYAI
jgi:hypothetical protein